MKNIFSIMILLCIGISAMAQEKITGIVLDDAGMPLPGVNVVIKHTTTGTITNIDGEFVLENVKSEDILVFSFISFKTVEKKVAEQSHFIITLQSESIGLNEVVAVGYGTTKKRDLTGAVAKVSPVDLVKSPTANYDQALAGRVAGVQVSSADGTPGEGLNIVIRGGNSITGDNSPLYVVDNIPLEDFDPASISSSDIKSFDVLKDASATAIYGSRGANGVIIITTKSGRTDGRTDISVNASSGLQWIPTRLEVLSPYEYVKYQKEVAYAKDGYNPSENVGHFIKHWIDPEMYRDVKGTSWQDEIFQTSTIQNYNLSLSTGNKTTTLYYSGEFLNQEGTLINTGFKKINNRLKFTHKLNDKAQVGGNLQYSYNNREGINIAGNNYTSIIKDAITFRPVEPLVSDGLVGGVDLNDPNDLRFNPVQTLTNTDRQRRQEVIRTDAFLNYKLTKTLSLRMSGVYQVDNRRETLFYGKDTREGTRGNDGINGSVINRRYQTLSTSNTLNFNKTYKKVHKVGALAGIEIQDRVSEYSKLKNTQLPTDAFGIDKISIGTAPTIPETSKSGNSLLSYFGRVNYSYKQRYLLTANFRADGSSKFNKDNRWGYFPSFSAAWRMGEEDFIRNMGIFSNLKLRGGWGLTGNNRIGDFAAFNLLNVSSSSGYTFNEQYIPGAYQSNMGVPDLRWETTAQVNVGIDMGFFNQRIQAVVDYYKKNTDDLLLNAEMALSTGFNRVQQNVGEVENQGLELSLNTVNVKTKNFKWATSFNISFNKNKTIKLNRGQDAIYTNPDWASSYNEYQYITKVGEPVGMIYGLEYERLYQYEDFVWDNKTQTYDLKEGVADNGARPVAPGSIMFKDQNGDGTINEQDRVIIGDPHPDHFGGLTNDFQWKNFDCQVFFQWSVGHDILNANRIEFEQPQARTNSGLVGLANLWTPNNTNTDVNTIRYQTVYGKAPKGNNVDDRYIEDGTYLKLKTVSLGYTLPETLLTKLGLKKCRVYVSGQNLVTWTNYSGYDPDVSVGKYGALTPHLDYSAYPQSSIFSGGVEVTF
ncbi:SusC/RagA family TonB-linked outer membrane protein [Plebeiibacterium marinum]|uniref:TonB-dependent receptor n=1 Tax=Plebeiibacterium marinum TaxID=2992111 RepID=A0AAE3MFM9_9BACT|nr:TonB-dependent receptor [Plebeiobacterium marinum]MCW3806654.1 TonB-dependent receptor [Plebeiobacterium marinum]